MEKKSILIILIIIILIAVAGFFAYNHFNTAAHANQVKVGQATFNLPEGFKETASNKSGFNNITNGYDTFLIKECGNDNVTKYIKTYKKQAERANKTIHVKDFNVNDTTVYKATSNGTQATHYWFTINGTVYTCYSWSDDNNMENILKNLIETSS